MGLGPSAGCCLPPFIHREKFGKVDRQPARDAALLLGTRVPLLPAGHRQALELGPGLLPRYPGEKPSLRNQLSDDACILGITFRRRVIVQLLDAFDVGRVHESDSHPGLRR